MPCSRAYPTVSDCRFSFVCLSVAPAPARVDREIRDGRFIPLTELTPAKCIEATNETDALVLTADGSLKVRQLDTKGQDRISQGDWLAASEMLVILLDKHHGCHLSNLFSQHFKHCRDIAREHSFELSVRYDIHQRNIFPQDPRHDLASLNTEALSICATAIQIDRSNALQAQLRQLQAVSVQRPKRPFSTRGPSPPPTSKRQRGGTTTTSSHCFRCGRAGHLPGGCDETTTVAGHAVAAPCTKSNSRNALLGPGGRSYCFNFARSSSCSFDNQPRGCTNFHGCSICRDTNHGAGRCPSAEST